MRIANFRSLEYGYDSIAGEYYEDIKDMVRTTEYIDVEFVPLEHKDIVKKQVAALNEVKKGIQAGAQLKINDLDRRIGELLALPQPE